MVKRSKTEQPDAMRIPLRTSHLVTLLRNASESHTPHEVLKVFSLADVTFVREASSCS